MKQIWLVIKKEFRDYFVSSIAYVVIVVFVVATGILFTKDMFIDNQADMRKFFEFTPLILIIIIPMITMRSWAEEKRHQTLEILLTLPISRWGLILAKFSSCLLFVLLTIFLTFPIPLTLNILGAPDNGQILGGYMGLVFLSASYIAIGQFVSINSKNQIVAFLLSVLGIVVLYLFGEVQFLQFLPYGLRDYFAALGLGFHFESIARGVLDTRDVFYYLSIVIMLFYFIYRSLERIRRHGR